MRDFESLNAAVIAAHEANDNQTLVDVYYKLGREEKEEGRELEAGFFLTQAYVYALEAGLKEAEEIREILRSMGREE